MFSRAISKFQVHFIPILQSVQLARFTKDLHRRIMFSSSIPTERPELYTQHRELEPELPRNGSLRFRSVNFSTSIIDMFKRDRRSQPNLLPTQEAALQWLLNHPEIIVFSADKNRGPVVMERDKYLNLT